MRPPARWVVPLLLCVLTFVCFIPTLGAGFVNWDDDKNFELNIHYRGLGPDNLYWMFTTTHMGLYIPISWITLGLDYCMWGMVAQGYHLTNVLLHVLTTLILYAVIAKLLARFWPRDFRLEFAAALGALFFAIHPLRVESVAWITERRDVVSTIFFLLSIFSHLRMRDEAAPVIKWYWFSLGFFLLALLSKSIVLTLPLVLLVLDAFLLRRIDRRLIVEKIPFVALMVFFAFLTFEAQKGVQAVAVDYPMLDRIMQPGFRACFYVWKSAAPIGLAPLYPMDYVQSAFQFKYLATALLAVGVTVGLVVGRKRWPSATAAWLCYLILLLPVIGIVQAGPQQVADRYSYLSCLPFAALVGGLLCLQFRRSTIAASLAVLIVLGILTGRQTLVWKDSIALWSHAIESGNPSVLAYKNLGLSMADSGDLKGALVQFTRAVELEPDNFQTYSDRADIRRRQGDWDGAIADADRALRGNPMVAEAYLHRGFARAYKGDSAGALIDMNKAFEIGGATFKALHDRAMVRQKQGDLDGAIADYSEAIRLRPVATVGYWNRALAWRQKGRLDAALSDFQRVIEMNPKVASAWVNRGQIRLAQGNFDGAIEDLTEAVRLDPNNGVAWFTRAAARARNDVAGAVADYEAALRVAPPQWPQRKQVELEIERLKGLRK